MKPTYWVVLAAIAFPVLAFAQNSPKPTSSAEAVYRQTHAVNEASLQGHVERNVDKICAAYTDDAVLLPPGAAQPIQGKKAIQAYYTEGLKAGSSLRIDTKKIRFDVLGPNHAVEVGSYSILYRAADAQTETTVSGTMLIGWEKNAAGAWKIKWDMWH